MHIFHLKCTKFNFNFGWGFRPRPCWELTALPRPHSWIWEGKKEEGEEGKKKRRGKGVEILPYLLGVNATDDI